MILLRFLVLSFCLVVTFQASIRAEDNVSVVASIDKETIEIAEPFVLSITASMSEGYSIAFPDGVEKIGEFEVLSHRDSVGESDDGSPTSSVTIREMTLETITTGDLKIPSLELNVSKDQKYLRTIQTEPISIQVVSVLEEVDPQDFRDIKQVVDLAEVETRSLSWIRWVAGSALGLVAISLIALRVSGQKKVITPAYWATQEFGKLRTSSAMKESQSKAVVERLESVLRTVCGAEFDFPATASSQKQLLHVMKKELPDSTFDRLALFFRQSEQVSFAGLELSPDQLRGSVDEAEALAGLISESANDRVLEKEAA